MPCKRRCRVPNSGITTRLARRRQKGSCFKQWAEPAGTVHALTVAEDVGTQLENVAKRKETEDGN